MALGLGLAGPHFHFSWPCSFQALLRLLFLFQLFVRLTLNRFVGYFNAVVCVRVRVLVFVVVAFVVVFVRVAGISSE